MQDRKSYHFLVVYKTRTEEEGGVQERIAVRSEIKESLRFEDASAWAQGVYKEGILIKTQRPNGKIAHKVIPGRDVLIVEFWVVG